MIGANDTGKYPFMPFVASCDICGKVTGYVNYETDRPGLCAECDQKYNRTPSELRRN